MCYLCILLLMTAIAEGTTRFFHLAPVLPSNVNIFKTDENLPYAIRPHAQCEWELRTGESRFSCSHNSTGLRDTEHSFKKPKNTYRILGLGDSFTYGYGVSFEQTYLYQLEKMLSHKNSTGTNIEIIKAGMPGYWPEPERILLEKYGMQYMPDLVLVGFTPRDVTDTFSGNASYKVSRDGYLMPGGVFSNLSNQLYVHSHFFRLLITKLWRVFKFNFFDRWSAIYQNHGFHEKDWLKIENEYLAMLSIVKKAGANLVIVHIPEIIPLQNNVDKSYPSRRLSNWCQSNGVSFIDVLPAMEEKHNIDSFYWKEGHCNAKGHTMIAKTIAAFLLKRGLLPERTNRSKQQF